MNRLRYDVYGAILGAGLPIVATIIEAFRQLGSVAPAALLRTHLHQPLLWIMDTTPFVLAALGKVIQRQHDDLVLQSGELVQQSDQIVRLEQARRESFDRTAKELSHAAQGLLGNVAAFTRTTSDAAASARQTTTSMSQLSQGAAAAALTAETVIGLAVRAERQSEQGLAQAEASSAEPPAARRGGPRLVPPDRGARRADARTSTSSAIGADRRGSIRADRRGAALVAVRAGRGADGLPELAEGLRHQAAETRSAAAQVRQILTDVHREMLAAMSAAEGGIERAQLGRWRRPAPARRSAGSPPRSLGVGAPRGRSRGWRSSRRARSSRC